MRCYSSRDPYNFHTMDFQFFSSVKEERVKNIILGYIELQLMLL